MVPHLPIPLPPPPSPTASTPLPQQRLLSPPPSQPATSAASRQRLSMPSPLPPSQLVGTPPPTAPSAALSHLPPPPLLPPPQPPAPPPSPPPSPPGADAITAAPSSRHDLSSASPSDDPNPLPPCRPLDDDAMRELFAAVDASPELVVQGLHAKSGRLLTELRAGEVSRSAMKRKEHALQKAQAALMRASAEMLTRCTADTECPDPQ